MIIIPQKEVLAIIGKEDSTTLWDWSRRKGWFPTANIPGRPPYWTERALITWINDDIPRLFEEGARIPELKTKEKTLAYQSACLGRLNHVKEQMAIAEKERAEREARVASIVRVFRRIPQTA